MKNLTCLVLASALVTGMCWADGAPVAVRVEVKPLEAGAEGTRVDVLIQVSPEDRGRIGSNAMVRIEIDGSAPPGQSPLWAVSLESDGSALVETMWPSGEHKLRVSIASSDGRNSGLWVGTVRIPGIEDEDPVPGEVEPAGAPAEPERTEPTIPEAEAAAAAAALSSEDSGAVSTDQVVREEADSKTVEEAVEEEIAEAAESVGEEQSTAAPVVMAAVVAQPVVEEVPPEDEPVAAESSEEKEKETEARRTDDDSGAAAAAAAVTAASLEPAREDASDEATPERADEMAESETEEIVAPPDDVAEPVAVAAATAPEQPSTEMGAEPATQDEEPTVGEIAAPTEPVVVPLRSPESEAVAEMSAPEALAVASTGSPSSENLAEYESWTAATAGTRDLTVVVTRNREPVAGLDRDSLSLRLDKTDVAIERLGDREQAPLNLGVAVDLSPASVSAWGLASRSIKPLIARTGGGHIFAATPGQSADWSPGPVQLAEVLSAPSGGDLDRLIVSSLARFEGRRGRSFLIVLTDGRFEPTKEGWKTASSAVAAAGVPILVIALWDDGFSKKVRKQLSQLAEASGGRLFLAQGTEQFGAAVERFGPLIDGGVALRFVPPAVNGAQSVAVTAVDSGIRVAAPKSIQ